MKLNYNQKFKDRTPKETISLIEHFFQEKGCSIKVNIQQESSTTWSAQLVLYHDNTKIATSNGKGLTEEFCLASAYAEVYERFCNKTFFISNYNLNKRIIEKTYATKGYYYSPEEKELTFAEAFDSIPAQYFLQHAQDDNSELETLFGILFDNRYIGLPFQNIENDNIYYLDPRISLYLTNSSGMAAGNTFYEAFNQAMSEIYEHYITGHYMTDIQDKYYSIDLDCIENPELKKIIDIIQKDNDLYILDFSYNYNIPVLMSIIVNHYTHAITANIGAFPVFEIAVERILTELYQGIYSHNDSKHGGQVPFLGDKNPKFADAYWPGCTMTRTIFPNHIITNMIPINTFNHNIFLQGNYSNEEIFNYIKSINKQQNFDTYYYDCSLCEDMFAIKIFVKNLPYLFNDFSCYDTIKNKSNRLLFLLKIHNILQEYLNGNEETAINNIINIITENRMFINKHDSYYISYLQWSKNQFIIPAGYSNSQNIIEIVDKLLTEKEFFLDEHCDMMSYCYSTMITIYEELVQYNILNRYLNSIDNYSTEELLLILSFLNINCSPEDINACFNNDNFYWIKKILFKDLDKLKNGYYDNLIEMLESCSWAK